MDPKEINSEQSKKLNLKKILVGLFLNKKFLIAMGIILFLIVVEFTTDFVEIVLGSIIELTNPYRPKSGTIWELYEKDRLANKQLEEITKSLPERTQEIPDIEDLVQLRTKLEEQQTIIITADQFRNLYNQISPRFAYDIISPFDLLKLSHSRKWVWTKIVKGENNLSFHFLDGDRQFLMDTYPPLSIIYNIPEAERTHQVSLDSVLIFKGRTFSRDKFFVVFDDLPNSVKLRLINNPFQLVKWDKNIQKVGISRYMNDNVVSIGFQINQGIYNEVYTFEASDWAVDYFIERMNELYPELNLDTPEEERYSAFPDFY